VAELRARGIKIEDYGTPGLNTEALADEAELDSQTCSRSARHRLEERECDRALISNGR
jgi:hypothetical protein